MKVLVTGGTGYIGSHAVLALLDAGHEPIVADSLVNSSSAVIDRLAKIADRPIEAHVLDLRDEHLLDELFASHEFDAVVHFAGLKSVSESVAEPLTYYRGNVAGSLTLLEVMARHDVRTLIFSSSATVYGAEAPSPLAETAPTNPVSPYGRTKLLVEQVLRDVADADPGWRIAVLRYFNPAGAHPSGLIGEDPRGRPNNLMPSLAQVAAGKLPFFQVFGDDYETPDGTGLRDYIHVEDLVAGHLAALPVLAAGRWRIREWNLGTGEPTSVLSMVRAFSAAVGTDLPYRVSPRRPGDVAVAYADPRRAFEELRWRPTRSVAQMCEDAWRWQRSNPRGYAT